MVYAMASSGGDKSVARSLGRRHGTSAPYFFEILGIYNRDISDFIHIIGVQYILSLALIIIIKKK